MFIGKQRTEATIYVTAYNGLSSYGAVVLPGLDASRRDCQLCIHSFVGKKASVIVKSSVIKISRSDALEIAARYVTGQCHISRIEFPQPPDKLKDIIQHEQRRKQR